MKLLEDKPQAKIDQGYWDEGLAAPWRCSICDEKDNVFVIPYVVASKPKKHPTKFGRRWPFEGRNRPVTMVSVVWVPRGARKSKNGPNLRILIFCFAIPLVGVCFFTVNGVI